MIIIQKILLAEDELIIAKVLQKILEHRHFEVRLVSDETEAVNAASDFNPDLIILDIHLRNKSCGIRAGRDIRKKGITSPIIFTTGNSFEQTKNEIKDIPKSHLFIKPVDTDQLIKFIEEL